MAAYSTSHSIEVRDDIPTQGKIVVQRKRPVTIHTYIAPDVSFGVTSHIIETAKSLVIVDTQFMRTFSKELRTYVNSLNKPIHTVILSHEHPDHWYGNHLFSDVAITSTTTVLQSLEKQVGSGHFQREQAELGTEAPDEPYLPDGKLSLETRSIDGLAYEFEVKTSAESSEELVIRLPEANTIIVQDLLYNGIHFFAGMDRNNWLNTLEQFKTLQGYDTLLVGHGMPASLSQIDHAIEYLTFANDLASTAERPEQVINGLQQRYPDYEGQFLLNLWKYFLHVPAGTPFV